MQDGHSCPSTRWLEPCRGAVRLPNVGWAFLPVHVLVRALPRLSAAPKCRMGIPARPRAGSSTAAAQKRLPNVGWAFLPVHALARSLPRRRNGSGRNAQATASALRLGQECPSYTFFGLLYRKSLDCVGSRLSISDTSSRRSQTT